MKFRFFEKVVVYLKVAEVVFAGHHGSIACEAGDCVVVKAFGVESNLLSYLLDLVLCRRIVQRLSSDPEFFALLNWTNSCNHYS